MPFGLEGARPGRVQPPGPDSSVSQQLTNVETSVRWQPIGGEVASPGGLRARRGRDEHPQAGRWGLRLLRRLRELGLSSNRLSGKASAAVRALPLGALVDLRLHANRFEERRPRLRNSDLSDSLGRQIARLGPPSGRCAPSRSMATTSAGAPRKMGEKGKDSDDEDDSDGEGGQIDPALKAMMERRKKARKKRQAAQAVFDDNGDGDATAVAVSKLKKPKKKSAYDAQNEDEDGRPVGLTEIELERALSRQRYCIHHTTRSIMKALGGDAMVLLDPPIKANWNSPKKALAAAKKKAEEEGKKAQRAALSASLRPQSGSAGRERDIPDYDEPLSPAAAAALGGPGVPTDAHAASSLIRLATCNNSSAVHGHWPDASDRRGSPLPGPEKAAATEAASEVAAIAELGARTWPGAAEPYEPGRHEAFCVYVQICPPFDRKRVGHADLG